MDALRIGASGMMAQQHRVEVVANNLANMNTTGYQRRRTEFHDLIYQNSARPDERGSQGGTQVPGGVQSGMGVELMSVYRVTEQGSLKATDSAFDVAIQGEGYFQVQLPNGETAYTRDGTFQIDGGGTLVTHDGFPVIPGIQIPIDARDVTIINVVIEGRLRHLSAAYNVGLHRPGEPSATLTLAHPPCGTGQQIQVGGGGILRPFCMYRKDRFSMSSCTCRTCRAHGTEHSSPPYL
jgi:flagellar hook-basal body protein